MVFKGQAEHTIDSKGRVAIPAKMRKVLGDAAQSPFTITRGFEQCVVLYPAKRWQAIEDEIAALNMYNRATRDFVRIIMMWAEDVSLDAQGRVRLPSSLVDFSNLQDTARIIGAFDHIEIWNPERFQSYLTQQPSNYETLAERVMGM
ncbi:MAG: division/cell wall cluster transcriptional repressor MraZ [Longimonas sp.]|uniref:division/cell wall cluster transcriptional repressor MraZ n=1 Tax=Longimonas sp. TaxID=2039626 RepID=UPI00335E5C84